MAIRRDFLGNPWDGCLGCALGDHSLEPPGGLIAESRGFVLHQDPVIPLPGFLVLASKRHVQSISDFEQSEYDEFSTLLRVGHEAVKSVTEIKEITIVQEEHSGHFHMWFFPWTEDVVAKYGESSLSKIREIMQDYRGCEIKQSEWLSLSEIIEQVRAEAAIRLMG